MHFMREYDKMALRAYRIGANGETKEREHLEITKTLAAELRQPEA